MSMGPPPSTSDAEKVLDFYIHDYMLRKNYGASAKTFQMERQVLPMSVPAAHEAEDGFLQEWWSLFTDVYSPHMSRKPRKMEASGTATPPQFSAQHGQQKNPAAYRRQSGTHTKDLVGYPGIHRSVSPRSFETNAILHNQGTAHATASRMFEEEMKLAQERDIDSYMRRPLLNDATGTPRPSLCLPRNEILGPLLHSSRSSTQSPDLGSTTVMMKNSTFGLLSPINASYTNVKGDNNSQLVNQWSASGHGNENAVPQNLSAQQISCVHRQSPRYHQPAADRPHQQLFLRSQVRRTSPGGPSWGDVERESDGACLQECTPGSPDQKSKDVPQSMGPTNQIECSLSKGTQEKDILMRLKQLARLHGQPKSCLPRQNQQKANPDPESKHEASSMNASAAEAKSIVPIPQGIPVPTPTKLNLDNPNTGLDDCRKRTRRETLLAAKHANSTEETNTGALGPSPTSAGIQKHSPALALALEPSSSNSEALNIVEKSHEPDYLAAHMESPFDLLPELGVCEEVGALEYDIERFLSYGEADPSETVFGELDRKEPMEQTLNAEASSLSGIGCLQANSSTVPSCDAEVSVDGSLLDRYQER